VTRAAARGVSTGDRLRRLAQDLRDAQNGVEEARAALVDEVRAVRASGDWPLRRVAEATGYSTAWIGRLLQEGGERR
jgi:hypothetical protein